MPITPLEKLHEEIEAHPEQLRVALERKLKAEARAAKLARDYADEEKRLTQSSGEDDIPVNERVENLKLDHELNKLQLRYDQKRGQLELEYRRNPSPGDKVAEATVAAYINSNEELTSLREEILQKQYERNVARTPMPPRLALRTKQEKTSEELERLRREWQEAQEALRYEEAQIKVLEEKLVIYGLSILSYWVQRQ